MTDYDLMMSTRQPQGAGHCRAGELSFMKRGVLCGLAFCSCFVPPVELIDAPREAEPEPATASQPPAVERSPGAGQPGEKVCMPAPVAPQLGGHVTVPVESFSAEATAVRPLAAAGGWVAWYDDRTVFVRRPDGQLAQSGHAMGLVSQLRLVRGGDGTVAVAFGDTQGAHASMLTADGTVSHRVDVPIWPAFELGSAHTQTTPVALAALGNGYALFWVVTEPLAGGQQRQVTMGQRLEAGAVPVQLYAAPPSFGAPQLLPVVEAVRAGGAVALLTGGRLLELDDTLSVVHSREVGYERPARLAWNATTRQLAVMTAEPGYRRPPLRVSLFDGLDGGERFGLEVREPAYVEAGGWSGHNGFDLIACGKGFFAVWRDDAAIAGCPEYGYCQVNDLVGAFLDGARQVVSRPASGRLVRAVSPALSEGSSVDLVWAQQPMGDGGMAESSVLAGRAGVADCSCLSP